MQNPTSIPEYYFATGSLDFFSCSIRDHAVTTANEANAIQYGKWKGWFHRVPASVLMSEPVSLALRCVPASSAAAPPQGTAEPRWENIFKKEQNAMQGMRTRGRKSVRNSPVNAKVKEDGRGGGAPGAGAEVAPQPVEGPILEQGDIS